MGNDNASPLPLLNASLKEEVSSSCSSQLKKKEKKKHPVFLRRGEPVA